MSGDEDEDEKESSMDDPPSSSREDAGVEGKMSVLVLTGSNQSGKSVYGKGVALIVYMAQIGWSVLVFCTRLRFLLLISSSSGEG